MAKIMAKIDIPRTHHCCLAGQCVTVALTLTQPFPKSEESSDRHHNSVFLEVIALRTTRPPVWRVQLNKPVHCGGNGNITEKTVRPLP